MDLIFKKELINNNMQKEIKKIKKYKISIITVCLNSEKTISKTLQSIKNQKHKQVEHLIIDGNSTDKTISIVKNFPHVNKIISKNDKGIYDAMNYGLRIASGEIIGFLNSDDFYTSSKVLSLVNKIFSEDPKLEACYADLLYINPQKKNKVLRYWKSGNFSYGSFANGWCPPHPTFFVKKSVYNRFGNFNLKYKIASDAELMMRFLEIKKIKVKYIPKILVNFTVGGVSNRNFKNIIKQNIEVLSALKKHKLLKNILKYFLYKIVLKSKQFFLRP